MLKFAKRLHSQIFVLFSVVTLLSDELIICSCFDRDPLSWLGGHPNQPMDTFQNMKISLQVFLCYVSGANAPTCFILWQFTSCGDPLLMSSDPFLVEMLIGWKPIKTNSNRLPASIATPSHNTEVISNAQTGHRGRDSTTRELSKTISESDQLLCLFFFFVVS